MSTLRQGPWKCCLCGGNNTGSDRQCTACQHPRCVYCKEAGEDEPEPEWRRAEGGDKEELSGRL